MSNTRVTSRASGKSSARITSRYARCSPGDQSTASGAVTVFANVTGEAEGRMRSLAHTIGFVVQRSLFEARVTGAAAGRVPLAAMRAHTAGFVVQRGGAAAATLTASCGAGGVMRAAFWAFWVFNRAHTAGLLLQRSAASLSPGAAHIRAPSRVGSAQRAKARTRGLPARADILDDISEDAVDHVLPSSSLLLTIIPLTSLLNHASRGLDQKGESSRAFEV